MSEGCLSGPNCARLALAAIRLFNGSAALLAPHLLAERLGVKVSDNQAIIYVFRMFGVRTILIGLELLVADGDALTQSVRRGILIHASDTTAAALAGLSGQLPPRAGVTTTLISATNTMLAIAASRGIQRSAMNAASSSALVSRARTRARRSR